MSSNVYCQGGITFDTLKNDNGYKRYIDLSKQILNSIKINEDSVINEYLRNLSLYERKNLKYNLSLVHGLLQNNNHVFLKSLVLVKSKLPYPGYDFNNTEIEVTYSLGRSGCIDPSFENTITIGFYDISKKEKNFEFYFKNCHEMEKVKKEILAIPVPKY